MSIELYDSKYELLIVNQAGITFRLSLGVLWHIGTTVTWSVPTPRFVSGAATAAGGQCARWFSPEREKCPERRRHGSRGAGSLGRSAVRGTHPGVHLLHQGQLHQHGESATARPGHARWARNTSIHVNTLIDGFITEFLLNSYQFVTNFMKFSISIKLHLSALIMLNTQYLFMYTTFKKKFDSAMYKHDQIRPFFWRSV